jgi:predicted TIM-barrel enzyme
MPLDTGLLYGEMVGSAIMHIAIPFAAILIIQALRDILPKQTALVFLGLCVTASFLAQMGFLTVLQANACSGVKNFGGIAQGALLAAIITGVLVAIPVFLEPMRHMVSQLFFEHQVLLTPELRLVHDIVAKAGADIEKTGPGFPAKMVGGGGAISEEDYEEQTLYEISAGSSYWGAFAGAYGVAFGSLMAASCPGASGP